MDPVTPNHPETLAQRLAACQQRVAQLEQELAQARHFEQQYRPVIDRTEDYAFILFDPDNRIVRWNRGATLIFGYQDTEIVGQFGALLFVPEDRRRGEPEREFTEARRIGRADDERWHLRQDGSRFWGSGVMHAIPDDNGQPQGFLKIVRDLTLRKQLEEQLLDSEQRFRLFVDNVTDYALIQVDLEGRISSWNPGAERTFGYAEHEIVGQPIERMFLPEDIAQNFPQEDLQHSLQQGRAEEARWMIRKDGQRFWSRWTTTPIRKGETLHGFAKVLRDETERQEAEDQLRISLLERETLLKEVHHRVKNNLQVIVSLLSLQSDQIQDPAALTAFLDTQNRVRAIAGIHEALYSSADLAHIEFGQYARVLVRNLFAFFDASPHRIHLQVETEDLVLDITQAIPLGLILNELIINCLKHAFPNDRVGTLAVSLRHLPERLDTDQGPSKAQGQLCVQDDGVGLPPGFDLAQAESMGMYLVRILTRQLNGIVTLEPLEPNSGTRLCVTFPLL